MGQLTVTINARDYAIACEDGDEPRIEALARELDRRVVALAESVGQVGHARLLAIASLIMADELTDARAEVERLSARVEALEADAAEERETAAAAADRSTAGERRAATTAQALEDAAQRIDAIAARLQSS